MSTPTDRERVVTARLSDVEREALIGRLASWFGGDRRQNFLVSHLEPAIAAILAARLAEAEQAAEQRGAERVLAAVEALAEKWKHPGLLPDPDENVYDDLCDILAAHPETPQAEPAERVAEAIDAWSPPEYPDAPQYREGLVDGLGLAAEIARQEGQTARAEADRD